MSKPVPTWNLPCPWCTWYIIVGARGMRGQDEGAGVEAVAVMERHMRYHHPDKTWKDYLEATAA